MSEGKRNIRNKLPIGRSANQILKGGIIISAILVLICLYTLSNNNPTIYPQELVEIDSLCNAQPYMAQTKLKEISKKYIANSDENNWYYRFLVIKAKTKLNEKFNDISEIKSIMDHYEQYDNRNILPQVFYCAGCIYRNLKDITLSNHYFLKCLDELEDTFDKSLLPLCNYQLGYNFSMQGLYKEALQYQLKSLLYNKKYNNRRRILADYEELAWTYGCIGNKKKAFEYIQKANAMAYNINDTDKISDTECQFAIHNMEFKQLSIAKKHIDIALNHPNKKNTSALYSTALEIYSKIGISDTAKSFCDTIISDGNIYGKKYAYWWLAVYYNKKGNLKSSLQYIYKYKEYSDSVSNAISAEASAKANALYNYGIKEKENITLKTENTIKTLYITIALSLLIVVILLSVMIYRKISHGKKAMEMRYRIIVTLREKENKTNEHTIKEKEKEIEVIKEKLSSLEENEKQNKAELGEALMLKERQLHEINNDITFKKLSDTCLRKSEIYKRIILLSENSSDIKFDEWNDLRKTIFEIYSSFEDRLSELCPMNDTELKTCLLVKIGLNSAKIAKFLNKSQNTIYSIKRRLCQKNFGNFASPSEWEKFIRNIY